MQAVDGVVKRVDREARVAEEEAVEEVVDETWRTSMCTWIASLTLRMHEDCGMNEKCTEMMIESFLSREASVGVDAVAEHRDAVELVRCACSVALVMSVVAERTMMVGSEDSDGRRKARRGALKGGRAVGLSAPGLGCRMASPGKRFRTSTTR